MTKLRGYIPTMLMLVTLMFGATAANAGIIIGDRTSSNKDNPCAEKTTVKDVFADLVALATTGIIIGDRTGIIIGDRTGIIIGDRTSQDTCGIIIGDRNDRTGIIIGD